METAERFTGRSAAYELYRTRFPEAVLERVQAICGLTSQAVVADVGAGTGMLAELFLRHGNSVFAVEPNAEMRQGCERLQAVFAQLQVVAGSAEATTLQEASIDLIAVGRAFHWFDRAPTMREFGRVLKPGGWLLLVTSRWGGDGSARALEFEEILKTKCVDYHRVLEALLSREEAQALFAGGEVHFEEIHGEDWVTWEQLLGRCASLSVTPRPGDVRYAGYVAALKDYFARYEEGGRMRVVVGYDLVLGRLG